MPVNRLGSKLAQEVQKVQSMGDSGEQGSNQMETAPTDRSVNRPKTVGTTRSKRSSEKGSTENKSAIQPKDKGSSSKQELHPKRVWPD
jgi:hypothetical protein